MRSFLKHSSVIIAIVVVCLPLFVFALEAPPEGGGSSGIVPCGTALNPDPCTFCNFIQLANNVTDFLFTYIVLPLMAVGILASGITILTSGGSSGQIDKGKKMLWNLGIGFFIAATAWVIVNMFLTTLVPTGSIVAYLRTGFTFPSCP